MAHTLLLGDCLEKMKEIPDNSVDLILTDPPYGTTQCKWDTIIPFEALWDQLWRVSKPNGAIVLFGTEPFSSQLRSSQIKWFKYDWIWQKDKPSGFLNAKKMPMRYHEVLSVFYKKQPTYNPQFWYTKPMNTVYKAGAWKEESSDLYSDYKSVGIEYKNTTRRYPSDIIKFNMVNGQSKDKTAHPTQKPVPLLEYFIKTYTSDGESVLDFAMGSGSTGVACNNLNRDFIGIEIEEKYFEIAKTRLKIDSSIASESKENQS